MELRIVAGVSPNRRSTIKVRVPAPRIGLSGPKTPHKFAGVLIVRIHMTAHPKFGAGNAAFFGECERGCDCTDTEVGSDREGFIKIEIQEDPKQIELDAAQVAAEAQDLQENYGISALHRLN